jgi:hypothetical protein
MLPIVSGVAAETRGAERFMMELAIATYPVHFWNCVVITKTGMVDCVLIIFFATLPERHRGLPVSP